MPTDHEVRDSDVAIIGMACRFPGADDVDQFWRNLREGRDSLRILTDAELGAAGVGEELAHHPRYVPAVQTIDGIDLFDAAAFDVPAEEAQVLDPQHRHLLECSLAALEHSGYDPQRYPGLIGVFAGTGLNSYALMHLADQYRHGSTVERYRLMLAIDKDYAATRVSYRLDLRGPSVNVSTACSTSLVAVHLACLSLLGGECDMALAGSAHIGVPQGQGYLFQEGMILSPDGRCRPFDAKAQGTVLGDGAGVVVLKRLRDALADGDTVHAVIKGSAINNDGSRKAGYTAPSVAGQAEAVRDAQRVADCPPGTIGYVEAHGTATVLGDPVEVAALNLAFRDADRAPGTCALGSVKGNVGHLDTAAGMAGLIKATLMARDGLLVPSLHFESPNPQIDFDAGPFYVNTELTAWPQGSGPRRAGVSSFGVGGTNAHVVLEQPPAEEPSGEEPAVPELLVLSAGTAQGLEHLTAELARDLRRRPGLRLRDVAATLALGRRELRHRRVLVSADRRDAAIALALAAVDRTPRGEVTTTGRPVLLVCTGAPAGEDGGGTAARALYAQVPAFRRCLDEALAELGGRDVDAVLDAADGSGAVLVEYVVARLWQGWGLGIAGVAGVGPGWRAAACVAGAIDLATALDPASGPPLDGAVRLPLWLAGAWHATGTVPGDFVIGRGHPVSDVPLPPGDGDDAVPVRLWPSADGPVAAGPAALLMRVGRAWLAGAGVDWARLHADRSVRRVPLPPSPPDRRRYWVDGPAASTGSDPLAAGTSLADAVRGCSPAERAEALVRYLQGEIGRVLQVEQSGGAVPDPDARLFDLAVESLMLIEVTERLSRELGVAIPASAFIDYPTIRAFVASLDEIVLEWPE